MQDLSRRRAIRLGMLAAAFSLGGKPVFAADQAPLAIRGYDPVAYYTTGSPTRGLPEFEYEWDEHRYRFARAEHRDLFKADPERYAPQFASYCAVALSRGELDEGNPEYWMISDGKLYLFGKPIGPELFRREYAGNLAKANENGAWLLKR